MSLPRFLSHCKTSRYLSRLLCLEMSGADISRVFAACLVPFLRCGATALLSLCPCCRSRIPHRSTKGIRDTASLCARAAVGSCPGSSPLCLQSLSLSWPVPPPHAEWPCRTFRAPLWLWRRCRRADYLRFHPPPRHVAGVSAGVCCPSPPRHCPTPCT